MLLTKTVILKWNPSNREHYTSKGYNYTYWHEEFEVKIDDLVDGNANELDLVCDYCDTKYKQPYRLFNLKYKNNPSGKHSCGNCNEIRIAENKLIVTVKDVNRKSTSNKETIYKININDEESIKIKFCKTCMKYKELSCFKENKRSNATEYSNQCEECDKEFKELNSITYRLKHIKETSVKMNLPIHMTEKQFEKMLNKFDNKCALSNSINVDCEHFIPVSWGHGGTYEGNVYLLNESLNRSKGSKNPFEWIKDETVKKNVNIRSWNNLIKYLASKNKLTVDEFKKFVYWCESNKRGAIEVELDNGKTSIELWKESINKVK